MNAAGNPLPAEAGRPALAGIVFDLDQTLFDRADAFARCVTAELDRIDARGRQRTEIRHALDAADRAGYGERSELLACMAAQFQWMGNDHEVAFRGALLPHVQLGDGVLRTLERLAGRVRLGLLTDGSALMQNAKIDALGVRSLFNRIQISGTFGESKPHRSTFEAFSEDWGVSADEMCMVGDHLERDVHGALAADWDAVWIAPDSRAAAGPLAAHGAAIRRPSVRDLDRFAPIAARLPQPSVQARATAGGAA